MSRIEQRRMSIGGTLAAIPERKSDRDRFHENRRFTLNGANDEPEPSHGESFQVLARGECDPP
ncbi:MAG TPA: hypothetical protein VIV65_03335, partial [Gemmatimonadaceae bacterium]